MANPKDAYLKEINRILKEFSNLTDATILKSIDYMAALEKQVAFELLQAPDYNIYHLEQVIANLQDDITQYEMAMTTVASDAAAEAMELGALYVVQPINTLGLEQAFVAANPMVSVLQGFSADLITDISNEILRGINTQLRLAAIGGLSPYDAMQRITDILGLKRDEVTGIAYRAEMILRTELQRLFNMSSYSQQLATASQIPDLLKTWIATADERTRHTHLLAHVTYSENPIPIESPYIVGGWPLQYPGDPAGPAHETINCRCSEGTVHPVIGVIPSDLDNLVKTEIERRQESWVETSKRYLRKSRNILWVEQRMFRLRLKR